MITTITPPGQGGAMVRYVGGPLAGRAVARRPGRPPTYRDGAGRRIAGRVAAKTPHYGHRGAGRYVWHPADGPPTTPMEHLRAEFARAGRTWDQGANGYVLTTCPLLGRGMLVIHADADGVLRADCPADHDRCDPDRVLWVMLGGTR